MGRLRPTGHFEWYITARPCAVADEQGWLLIVQRIAGDFIGDSHGGKERPPLVIMSPMLVLLVLFTILSSSFNIIVVFCAVCAA